MFGETWLCVPSEQPSSPECRARCWDAAVSRMDKAVLSRAPKSSHLVLPGCRASAWGPRGQTARVQISALLPTGLCDLGQGPVPQSAPQYKGQKYFLCHPVLVRMKSICVKHLEHRKASVIISYYYYCHCCWLWPRYTLQIS